MSTSRLRLPAWRCFQSIASDAEASQFSECALFSLATLEVECDLLTGNFALTEQEGLGSWRWAVISDRSVVIATGKKTTQADAKTIADEALYFRPTLEP